MTYTVGGRDTTRGGMACKVTASAKNGLYRIETDVRHRPEPEHGPDAGRLHAQAQAEQACLQLYVRFDPTVNGNGGGGSGNGGADSATVDDTTGHPILVASDPVTATNAANRDYAQPVFAALDGSFTEASERLRRRRRATGSCSSTTAHALDADLPRRPRGQRRRGRRGSRSTASGKTLLALGFGAIAATRRSARPTDRWRPTSTDALRCLQEGLESVRRRRSTKPRPRSCAGFNGPDQQAAGGRLLPERQRAQGLRGQDVPRRDRGQPRLAVGPGGFGRRPGEHLLRFVSRGLRARPVRGLDRACSRTATSRPPATRRSSCSSSSSFPTDRCRATALSTARRRPTRSGRSSTRWPIRS